MRSCKLYESIMGDPAAAAMFDRAHDDRVNWGISAYPDPSSMIENRISAILRQHRTMMSHF
jgi:hypothetical protein